MLEITIPKQEQYDEEKNEFNTCKEYTLRLEHSLVSLSKWESKWHKPFLESNEKTGAELIDYIRCMTITQNVDPSVYNFLTQKNIDDVMRYIKDPMTATTFKDMNNVGASREIVTAEIIYYWMVALEIPFECQKWHLNRLLTLIKVCNIKNQPSKKMPTREILRNNRMLNAARRSKFHTKG